MSANAFAGRSAQARVLHVYRTYFPDPPGGVQETIRQICRSTKPFGFQSTLFCLSPQPRPATLHEPEVTVQRARSWMAPASCDLGSPASIRDFSRLAAKHDIIHYHYPWPFGDLLDWAGRRGKPAVLTYHSDIVRQSFLARLYAPLMWRTLTSMSAIIATSPAYARTSAVLSDPRIAGHVRTIPLGMADLAAQTSPDEHAPVAIDTAGRPYFLFLGALRYYKGLPTLIEAANRVNAPILIAGTGPREDMLKRMAQRSGATNVEFLGAVSEAEKRALLANCHAFVLPSNQRSEAFGMALVEAAMFAKPMISCEIGTGTSFVNIDEETGLVVAPDDPDALAQAMNRILADGELARQLGANARQRYESHFSQSALGNAHAQLYRQLIGGTDRLAANGA